MASAAKKSYGILFKQGSTTIAEVDNIGDVGPECETIEVTNFDSTNGWREYIAGLKQGGTLSIDLNFLAGNSTQQGIRSAVGGDAQTFSVVFHSSAETYTFSAIVTSFKVKPQAPNSKLSATAQFQLTGEITFS